MIFQQSDADKMYEIPKTGINRQLHSWIQFSFGSDMPFGELDSKADALYNYYGFTYNRKIKFNAILSHGYGLGVHHQLYPLNQRGLSAVQRDTWDRGRLIYNGVNMSYFVRINFDPKRGNRFGIYMDLATFGQFNFHQRAKFVHGNLTEKVNKENFPERFAAGVETRVGYESLSLYVRYKFFSERPDSGAYTNVDLAKWSAGLNIAIFNFR